MHSDSQPDLRTHEEAGLGFFRGLIYAVALGALAWGLVAALLIA